MRGCWLQVKAELEVKLEDEREARDREVRQLRARLETLQEELQIEREGYNKTTHVSFGSMEFKRLFLPLRLT